MGGWRRAIGLAAVSRVSILICVVNDNSGAGVSAGDGPDEGDDPADEGPAQEEVEYKNASGACAFPEEGDDGGEKIGDNGYSEDSPGKGEGEDEE